MNVKNTFKMTIFSLLPLIVLLVLVESILAVLGLGKPFERPAMFWSGGMHLMQYDQNTGIRMRPNLADNFIKLNSLGLRDDELDANADVKILSLGDSCAFGWGLDRMELTYAAQLQHNLNEQIKKRGRTVAVEVLNAGTPSYTVYQGLQLYLKYLKPISRWDFVLISFGWNEIPGKELDLEFALRNPPIENNVLRELRSWAKHLHLYNALEAVLYKSRLKSIHDPYLLAQGQYETYYTQLVRAVQRNGARAVVMAVITVPGDQSPLAQRMRFFNSIAKKIAEREGAYWIDLNPAFSLRDVNQPLVQQKMKIKWFDEFHYDSTGHELVAKELSELLLDAVMKKGPEGK